MGKLIHEFIFCEALTAAVITALTICIGFNIDPLSLTGSLGETIIPAVSKAFAVDPNSPFYFDPVKTFKEYFAFILIIDLILNALTVFIAYVGGWGTRIALLGGYFGGLLFIFGIFNGFLVMIIGFILMAIGNISALVTPDRNIQIL